MPGGWERLNAPSSVQPNPNIAFIKPLPGSTSSLALHYLQSVAAICVPIMRGHSLSVTTLEEYPPNREFVGRNFNGGEIIQLVLRAPKTNHWLPLKSVMMVMMHELAHCKHMNHSKAFWGVRNGYAGELRGLWTKGYKGEGLWGRGFKLGGGSEVGKMRWAELEELPSEWCGGSYASRGSGKGKKPKKQNEKPKRNYKEEKERRIVRRFGAGGQKLGEGDSAKKQNGAKSKTRPASKVAGSKRARELRASAALARFDVQKKEAEAAAKLRQEEELSLTESDTMSETESESEAPIARDVNGRGMVDGRGRELVRVCGGSQHDETGVKGETQDESKELQDFFDDVIILSDSGDDDELRGHNERADLSPDHKKRRTEFKLPLATPPSPPPPANPRLGMRKGDRSSALGRGTTTTINGHQNDKSRSNIAKSSSHAEVTTCPVCTAFNDSSELSCASCGNVLQSDFVVGTWRCRSSICADGKYINDGDRAVCGACGLGRFEQVIHL